MKSLQINIDYLRKHLQNAQLFADRFGPMMPEDFPGGLSFYEVHCGCGRPLFNLSIPEGLRNEQNRDLLLSTAGDIFGRHDWTRSLNYDRTAFDWRKTLEGIDVRISNAEILADPRDKTPVLPNEFPLLLNAPERSIPNDPDGAVLDESF